MANEGTSKDAQGEGGIPNFDQLHVQAVASLKASQYWVKRAIVMERLLRSLRQSKDQLEKIKLASALRELQSYDLVPGQPTDSKGSEQGKEDKPIDVNKAATSSKGPAKGISEGKLM